MAGVSSVSFIECLSNRMELARIFSDLIRPHIPAVYTVWLRISVVQKIFYSFDTAVYGASSGLIYAVAHSPDPS